LSAFEEVNLKNVGAVLGEGDDGLIADLAARVELELEDEYR